MSTLLSGCATTYDSAGNPYLSVWPFIGSRNPDLQLNYPAQDPNRDCSLTATRIRFTSCFRSRRSTPG